MNDLQRSGLQAIASGRIYVQDRGPVDTGCVPVLLVHGYLVTHYEWRVVVQDLAGDRRVIAPDLPGCGESDRPPPHEAHDYSFPWLAESLLDVLDVLKLDRVDVVAHSMGGTVAICLAEQAPLRVRKLVLVDPSCFTMPLPLEGRIALLPGIGQFVFRSLYRRADLRRYMARVYSTPELLDERAIDIYWDRLAREGGRDAALAMLRQLANLDHMRERFKAITMPTLVVWGDRDRIIVPELGDRLVELLPNAILRTIEGCGHAANEERPEALLPLIREHLDGSRELEVLRGS